MGITTQNWLKWLAPLVILLEVFKKYIIYLETDVSNLVSFEGSFGWEVVSLFILIYLCINQRTINTPLYVCYSVCLYHIGNICVLIEFWDMHADNIDNFFLKQYIWCFGYYYYDYFVLHFTLLFCLLLKIHVMNHLPYK